MEDEGDTAADVDADAEAAAEAAAVAVDTTSDDATVANADVWTSINHNCWCLLCQKPCSRYS